MSPMLRAASATLALMLSAPLASAQPCYDWGTEFGLPDLDGGAFCGLRHDDGNGPAWYIGGQFVKAGEATVNHIARFDGSAWTAMDGGLGVGGATGVFAMTMYDDGNGTALYIGGIFEQAGGDTIYSIARWTGSQWAPLGPGFNGAVYSLLVHDDGSGPALYASGRFTELRNGVAMRGVARWDGASWTEVGGGVSGSDNYGAHSLVGFDDGSGPALFAGGDFTAAGDQVAYCIAKWDGAAWSAVGLPFQRLSQEGIASLASFDEDGPGGAAPALFAAGRFDRIGDTQGFLNIARWNGSAWTKVGGGLAGDANHNNPKVQTLTVFDDNSGPALFAGGDFQFAGFTTAKNVAKWDGQAWSKLDKGTDGPVTGLIDLTQTPGEPFLGVFGVFSTAGGIRSPWMAEWTGLEWLGRGNSISSDGKGNGGAVWALTDFDDGAGPAVYAGGPFQFTGGLKTSGVARWDGSQWSDVGGGIPGGAVTGLVSDGEEAPSLVATGDFGILRWDGSDWLGYEGGFFYPGHSMIANAARPGHGLGGASLFAGGRFRGAGGTWAPFFASTDGAEWQLYPSLQDETFTSVVFDDGNGPALYVGGRIGLLGGDPQTGLARWDGQQWVSVGDGVTGTVMSLAAFDDGGGPALFIGGQLGKDLGNEVFANAILRWDGANWSNVAGGFRGEGSPATVFDLMAFDDGSGPALYAAGGFSVANAYTPQEVAVGGIARWNGSSWGPVGPRLQPPAVLALDVFDVGGQPALFAAGAFTGASDGTPLNYVARWDGAAWHSLGTGLSEGNNIRAMAMTVFDEGNGPRLFVAGDFQKAGNTAASRIARWDGAAWTAVGSGLSNEQNAAVNGLTVFDDGQGAALYVAGTFQTAGGVEVLGTARWTGAAWEAGPGTSGRVNGIRTLDLGGGPRLVLEGNYGFVGLRPALNIAQWDGEHWWPLADGTDLDVASLLIFDDGSGPALYAGGLFTHAGGVEAPLIARWDGSSWSPVGGGMEGNPNYYAGVYSLVEFDDGSGPALYAGGEFTSADGSPANCVARWDGQAWSPVGDGLTYPDHQQPAAVMALAVFDDGDGPALYAAGRFTASGGAACRNVARWTGQDWVEVGGGLDLEAAAIAGAGDSGSLFVGGWFAHAGSTGAGRLARWGPCPGFIKNECYADFTGEGSLDLFDFLAYVNAFNLGDAEADCDHSGGLNLFDFLCFVNAFNNGC